MERQSLTSRIVSAVARVVNDVGCSQEMVTDFVRARASFSRSVAVAGETIRDCEELASPDGWDGSWLRRVGLPRRVRRFVTAKTCPSSSGETIRDERNLLHHLHSPFGDLAVALVAGLCE